MSPLPEVLSNKKIFTTQEEQINHFFEDDIGPQESWSWTVNFKTNNDKRKELLSKFNANQNEPFEFYSIKRDKGVENHIILSTNSTGVYIEIVTFSASGETEKADISRGTTKFIVHRYGEEVEEKYIDSLVTY